MPELLVEIGTEEIPASFLAPAAAQLKHGLEKRCTEAGLPFGEVTTAWTCRRLALHVGGLPSKQQDRREEIQGPPAKVAFDSKGRPTAAGEGFARSRGVAVQELEVRETPQGRYCFARRMVPGRKSLELLAEMLPGAIAGLNFPKSMRWESGSFYFARPIRSIAALFDEEVVEFELAGVKSGRTIRGHRFLAPKELTLESADFGGYQRLLRDNFVLVDPDERKELVVAQAEELLAPLGSKLCDAELLEEVNALVEYPTVIQGGFSQHHLEIPEPVLLKALRKEQRYFAIRDAGGKLVPQFLGVSDRDASASEVIRRGYERVLEAKLTDARFFWNEDAKVTLADKREKLSGIVFHPELGTYGDKADRLQSLVAFLGESLGFPGETVSACRRAARLCKVDLVTLTVQEFPSLEGVVGRELALSDGEPTEVAEAIGEHYQPRSGEDQIPESLAGGALSIADKLDNLGGCFLVGLVPTGSQDPYGLRRDALAVIHIILEKGFNLSLAAICEEAIRLQPESLGQRSQALESLLGFFRDRLYLLLTSQGYSHDLVRGVMTSGFDRLSEFTSRLQALAEVSKTAVWPGLVRAVERTYNISRGYRGEPVVDDELFETDAERKLWKLYHSQKAPINALLDEGRYEDACIAYADAFDQPLHKFFEEVFVNVDDLAVRNNRQAILKAINQLFSARVADLSQIIIPEE